MQEPFIQQLQTEIDKKHLPKHPFFLSLMHSGCDVFESRQAITNNLYDEKHGEKNYGIHDARGTEFFKLQGVLDMKHANVWWNIILQHANTPEQQLAVMETIKNGRDSLYGFLDGVCREYGTGEMKKMC